MLKNTRLELYDETTKRKIAAEDITDGIRSVLESALAKNPRVTTATLYLVKDARQLALMPTNAAQREILTSEMREYLNEELKFSLSHSDYDEYQNQGAALPADVRARVVAAIDTAILQLAHEHGTGIAILPEIIGRMNEWEIEGEAGADLHRKLANQYARRTMLNAGRGKAPLDWWARNGSAMLQELKHFRDAIGRKLVGDPDNRTLSDIVDDLLASAPEKYPLFWKVGINLQAFTRSHPLQNRNFFVARELTPGLFRDELMAWSTNRTPESDRQVASRIAKPNFRRPAINRRKL